MGRPGGRDRAGSVLVMIPHAAVRDAVVRFLASEGVAAWSATSADEAIASLERAPFDALVCADAPGDDGAAALIERARRTSGAALLAVVVLHDADRPAPTEGGVTWLARPVRLPALLEAIRALARRSVG